MSQLFEFATNHWMLVLAFFVVLGLVLGNEVQRALRGLPEVGPMEATRLMNQENALFIDTREEAEFKQGHILNATHMPMSEFKRRLGELDKHKGRPVVTYCRSGSRSAHAGGQLKRHGFETVYNLHGGILAWQNANLPVTKQ